MPCPTCGQTMQGIGHGAARKIIEAMGAELIGEAMVQQPDATKEAMFQLLREIHKKLADENAPDFWCPNCGTVSDTPPRIVERVKAADDTAVQCSAVSAAKVTYPLVGFMPALWADVCRCIGREKP